MLTAPRARDRRSTPGKPSWVAAPACTLQLAVLSASTWVARRKLPCCGACLQVVDLVSTSTSRSHGDHVANVPWRGAVCELSSPHDAVTSMLCRSRRRSARRLGQCAARVMPAPPHSSSRCYSAPCWRPGPPDHCCGHCVHRCCIRIAHVQRNVNIQQ